MRTDMERKTKTNANGPDGRKPQINRVANQSEQVQALVPGRRKIVFRTLIDRFGGGNNQRALAWKSKAGGNSGAANYTAIHTDNGGCLSGMLKHDVRIR